MHGLHHHGSHHHGGTVAPPRATASVAVVVLCIGSLCGALMQSLVIPIQGELPALLSTSASNSSWAVTATLLAGAVSMPVTGRLADMYGKKRVLLATSLVLAAGSLVAALSSTLAPFLAGRVLQGMPLLSAMPRGAEPMGFYTKPAQRVPITSVRLAADVPASERVPIEVLRTDSASFAALVDAKRNRLDDFYRVPAGKVDVCSVSIPMREAKSSH